MFMILDKIGTITNIQDADMLECSDAQKYSGLPTFSVSPSVSSIVFDELNWPLARASADYLTAKSSQRSVFRFVCSIASSDCASIASKALHRDSLVFSPWTTILFKLTSKIEEVYDSSATVERSAFESTLAISFVVNRSLFRVGNTFAFFNFFSSDLVTEFVRPYLSSLCHLHLCFYFYFLSYS